MKNKYDYQQWTGSQEQVKKSIAHILAVNDVGREYSTDFVVLWTVGVAMVVHLLISYFFPELSLIIYTIILLLACVVSIYVAGNFIAHRQNSIKERYDYHYTMIMGKDENNIDGHH